MQFSIDKNIHGAWPREAWRSPWHPLTGNMLLEERLYFWRTFIAVIASASPGGH
jgi:hypothetical protein